MGSDIHGFIERRPDKGTWSSVSSGQLSLNRDYFLFSLLADVRSRQPGDGLKPKGLPDDFSYTVLTNLFQRIVDDPSGHNSWVIARKDVARYCSATAKRVFWANEEYVIDEDFHSITHVNEEELRQISGEYQLKHGRPSRDCLFLCETMQAIRRIYDEESRFICWFDS